MTDINNARWKPEIKEILIYILVYQMFKMTTFGLDAHSESLDHQTCLLCGHTSCFPGNLIHGTVTWWGQVIGVVAAKYHHFQSVCQRTAHTSNASGVCWNVEHVNVCSRMRNETREAVSIGPYVPTVDLVFTDVVAGKGFRKFILIWTQIHRTYSLMEVVVKLRNFYSWTLFCVYEPASELARDLWKTIITRLQ